MKRMLKLSTIWLLAFVMVFTLFACIEDDPGDNGNGEPHVLAAEYEFDISPFGMPLVFYLRIHDDGSFMLAPNRDFDEAECRGAGQLAESEGTYLMIYEDHTPETPKTATFVVENGNLVFQTTLPYGASNIMQSKVDDDDPEIVHILTAHVLVHEALYGVYAGSHSVQAMGSTVVYNYTMTLKSGLRYVFHSEFVMGGTPYEHTEVGFWDVDGETFMLKPAGEDEVTGTIVDGVIETSIKASWMATTRTETTLQLATHAQYAGVFEGEKVTMMYTAAVSLELDMFGGYVYTADVGQPEDYVETGTYEIDGTTVTFTPGEGDSYTATLANYKLEGDFKVIGAMPATDLVFYNTRILGTFTGSATYEEIVYTTTLVLNPDGTFDLTIVDDDMAVVVEEDGSFNIIRTMMVMIVLVDVVPAPSVAVSATGFNFTMVLPGMDDGNGMGAGLGFSLTK